VLLLDSVKHKNQYKQLCTKLSFTSTTTDIDYLQSCTVVVSEARQQFVATLCEYVKSSLRSVDVIVPPFLATWGTSCSTVTLGLSGSMQLVGSSVSGTLEVSAANTQAGHVLALDATDHTTLEPISCM
jgi:hypothetical protein